MVQPQREFNPYQLTIGSIEEYKKATNLNESIWGDKYVLVAVGKGDARHVECHKYGLLKRCWEFLTGNLRKHTVLDLLNTAIMKRNIGHQDQLKLKNIVDNAFGFFKKRKI